MRFIGKFLNKLQSFPEYSNLSSAIENLQKQDGNILSGLQKAFGSSLNDFARIQSETFKNGLMSISESADKEIEVLRNLFSTTSSLPNDLRQLNTFHEDIMKKRKETADLQMKLDKYEKEVNSARRELENAHNTSMSSTEKAKLQSEYEPNCQKRQETFEALEESKRLIEIHEANYRKTVMQIIVTVFEAYVNAFGRAMDEVAEAGQKMIEVSDQLDDTGDDPQITELEARLSLLETETID